MRYNPENNKSGYPRKNFINDRSKEQYYVLCGRINIKIRFSCLICPLILFSQLQEILYGGSDSIFHYSNKVKLAFYCQCEVRADTFSLPLRLGTNGFTRLLKLGSGRSEQIKVLSLDAGIEPVSTSRGGQPAPFTSQLTVVTNNVDYIIYDTRAVAGNLKKGP